MRRAHLVGAALPLAGTSLTRTGRVAARTGVGKTESRLHRIGLAATPGAFAPGPSRPTIGRTRLTELTLTLSTTLRAPLILTALAWPTLAGAPFA